MSSCRTLTCVALVPEGQFYCNPCGGLARASAEGLLDTKPERAPREDQNRPSFASKPNGQAVANGKGLSRFTRASTLSKRRERNRAKQTAKETARKEARKGKPKKGDGKKGDGKKKGNKR